MSLPGRPDELVKKSPRKYPNPFFAEIGAVKGSQEIWDTSVILKICLRTVNKSPIGKHLPTLVTLGPML
jgi:hypothetical protein